MASLRNGSSRFLPVIAATSLLAIVVSASPLLAQGGPSGFTLGTGLAYGFDRFDGAKGVENAFGWDLRGGYRAGYVGADVGLQYFPSFDVAHDETSGEIKDLLIGANVKVYPLPDWSFEPYALAGVGMTRIESDTETVVVEGEDPVKSSDKDTGVVLRFGAGFEFSISEGTAVFFEGSYVLDLDRNPDADIVPIVGGIRLLF